jgi:uncharacterized membrane protein YvlD (DUF360 family)
MKLIFGWVALTVATVVCVAVLPGLEVDWTAGVYCAVAFGFAALNVVMAWVLTAIPLPLRVSTWGPIALILNTAAFLITDRLMGSLHVDGLAPALIGAAVISFVDLVIEAISRSFRTGLAESARGLEQP